MRVSVFHAVRKKQLKLNWSNFFQFFFLLVTELIHQLNAACELDFIIYVIMPVNFSYFFSGSTSRKITLPAENLQKRNTRAV